MRSSSETETPSGLSPSSSAVSYVSTWRGCHALRQRPHALAKERLGEPTPSVIELGLDRAERAADGCGGLVFGESGPEAEHGDRAHPRRQPVEGLLEVGLPALGRPGGELRNGPRRAEK